MTLMRCGSAAAAGMRRWAPADRAELGVPLVRDDLDAVRVRGRCRHATGATTSATSATGLLAYLRAADASAEPPRSSPSGGPRRQRLRPPACWPISGPPTPVPSLLDPPPLEGLGERGTGDEARDTRCGWCPLRRQLHVPPVHAGWANVAPATKPGIPVADGVRSGASCTCRQSTPAGAHRCLTDGGPATAGRIAGGGRFRGCRRITIPLLTAA